MGCARQAHALGVWHLSYLDPSCARTVICPIEQWGAPLTCWGVCAQVQPAMARDLFPAGFVSCWGELEGGMQEALVRSLEAALASPTIPPDIVTTLLNLAEFMEHDEKSLPLDTRTLGALAEKCHAFAKALHYKELEYHQTPGAAVEALISINNHLRQPEAAIGILTKAQQDLHMELKESWYEKLQRWEEALEAYERKYAASALASPAHLEATLGRMRCLAALAEWEQLGRLCRGEWRRVEPHVRRDMAALAAHAAWHLGEWDEMAQYVGAMATTDSPDTSSGAFLSAVLSVRRGDYGVAKACVERARELLGAELAALVGESYERAYGDMVRVQQLTELEETVDYSLALVLAQGALPCHPMCCTYPHRASVSCTCHVVAGPLRACPTLRSLEDQSMCGYRWDAAHDDVCYNGTWRLPELSV